MGTETSDVVFSWPQENVVPEWSCGSLYLDDPVLRAAVARHKCGWAEDTLRAEGQRLADPSWRALAREADLVPPRLERYDSRGRRIDRLVFHPAWHALQGSCVEAGLHIPAGAGARKGSSVARAALYLLHGRIDAATLCPTTMTYAAIPLLEREDTLWRAVGGALGGRTYDPSERPLAGKTSGLVGMGLTEIQGGSDLRRVTTRATPVGRSDGSRLYRLSGRKWFFSAPQSDAHLVLARDGQDRFGCYCVPRVLPDGSRNTIFLERLKDKVGNRGNATAEAVFENAWAYRLGEPGRGLALLMEMAGTTRLDNVLGSAALLRQGLTEAVHYTRARMAFGRRLVDQPLMVSVLADLALESASATSLGVALARLSEGTDPLDVVARRLLVPAAKFWVCKRTVSALAECAEILGGNGYVEESALARFYREAPVNSIWEGSGNVVCLDVLRTLRVYPEESRALFADWERRSGGDPGLRRAVHDLVRLAYGAVAEPALARLLSARLVLVAQAFELRTILDGDLYPSFLRSRLDHASWGSVAGLTPQVGEGERILDRTFL